MWAFERSRAALAQQATLLSWQLDALRTACGPTGTSGARKPASPSVFASLPRVAARKVVQVGALVALVPGLVLVALLAIQAASAWATPTSAWAGRLDTLLRPAVYDSTATLIGFIPPEGETDLHAGHAARPGAVPEACVDLVLAREDAHHDSWWRHVRGVDLGSVARAAVSRGGASTIPMQVARQLAPRWSREHSRWIRKVLEAGAAATLVDLHGGDMRAMARTYLSIAPFGTAYGDLRGIAAAADVLWGIDAAKLSPAQCAVLVVLLPVRFNFAKADTEPMGTLWTDRVKCARDLLLGSARYAAFAPELALWPAPPRRADIPGLSQAATLNLGARTQALVLPHLQRIKADQPRPESPLSVAAGRPLEASL